MARKKPEESSAGAPWMNTFADLMNLLLCFFVLLFATSSQDTEQYDMVAQSMSSRFGSFSIFDGGGSAVGEGELISSGISQLNNLDNYYNTMGKAAEESGEDVEQNEEGKGSSGSIEGSTSGEETSSSNENTELNDAKETILEQNKEASQETYDKVAEMSEQNKVSDYMQLSIDPNAQYVQISLSGSILFASGEANLKKEALPIFNKVGDILKTFKGYKIEIEGHTDNVPIHNSNYISNNWLSSARALNAATYLIEEKKLSPKTLSWTGRGEYDPIASNKSEDGRAKNRRVEIKIYNNLDK